MEINVCRSTKPLKARISNVAWIWVLLKCANLKKTLGGESNTEGAELSIGGAEGHPKSIQIDTSAYTVSRTLLCHTNIHTRRDSMLL